MPEKQVTGLDIIHWMESQPEGFHGVVTNPEGADGFVSKVGGAFSWYRIGEGQNPTEVLQVAKALHDSLGGVDYDAEELKRLGREAIRLSRPKVKNS
jgi:hypothetical protein